MNTPSLKTRFFGHPLVALPTYGLGGFILYQWAQDGSLWPLGVGALCAISATLRAGEQADAYRNWKRAWDAMGDDPLPSGRGTRAVHFIIGVALIGALAFYLLSQRGQADYQLALGWMVLVGGAGLAALFIKWALRLLRNRQPKPAKTQPVTVAIARPLLAVPDMRQCYRQLPEHCHRLLQARPADGVR